MFLPKPMPKFYCDYCDIYLAHSSIGGRRQHCIGRKHIQNKVEYYQKTIRELGIPLIGLPAGGPVPPPPAFAGPTHGGLMPPPPIPPGGFIPTVGPPPLAPGMLPPPIFPPGFAPPGAPPGASPAQVLAMMQSMMKAAPPPSYR
jgi:U1 small nuclear ribonucleoprotein C